MSKLSKAKAVKRKQKAKHKHTHTSPAIDGITVSVSTTTTVNTDVIPDADALEQARHCLTTDINSIEGKQRIPAIRALARAADYYQQQDNIDSLQYRQRVLKLLDSILAIQVKPAAWLSKLYSKQLRQTALISAIQAKKVKQQHIEQALYYADNAVRAIEKLYQQNNEQPAWLNALYAPQLKIIAFSCDQLANSHKQQDDSQAVHYWDLGIQAVEKLFNRFPEQPKNIAVLYNKQLRQSALVCDRLAKNAKTQQDEALVEHYCDLSLHTLNKLQARFPEQPAWVTKLAAQHAKAYLLRKQSS